jgi:hypothetical protein
MPNPPGDLMGGGLGPGGIGGTPPGGGPPPAGQLLQDPQGPSPRSATSDDRDLLIILTRAKTDLNEGDWWTVAEKLVSDHEFSPNWVGRKFVPV